MHVYILFLIVHLFERVRERQEISIIIGSLSRWLQQSMLGQARARSQELCPGPLRKWQGPSYQGPGYPVTLHCSSEDTSRELHWKQKQSSLETHPHPHGIPTLQAPYSIFETTIISLEHFMFIFHVGTILKSFLVITI